MKQSRNTSRRLKRWSLLLTGILAVLLVFAGLRREPGSSSPEDPSETDAPSEPETTASSAPSDPADPIQTLLASMTLREKVGQLFIVRPDALDPSQTAEQIISSTASGVTALSDAMAATLAQYPVGGIVLFSKNITSPEQVTAFNKDLQAASSIGLFLCVDEEGGAVARLANHASFDLTKYKSAAAVGATGDTAQAYGMGNTIGAYLAEFGFNVDFAPVADVNTNPDNPVIGTRAFSSDPEIAAQMAAAMAQGLNAQGITATFKHFPGHGDTAEDSHLGLAVSYRTQTEMEECEWLPFLEADSDDFVMVGHIAVPEITGDRTPASVSYTLVTELLKETLGFDGLVITDSMEMGGITQLYSSGEAAVAALQAGCDLILMPQDLAEAFDAVLAALEEGSLTQEWLDATVTRILTFKQAQGIL